MKIGFLTIREKTPLVGYLVKRFPNIEFWDKREVEQGYEKRWTSFCANLMNLCKDSESIEFLVIFDKKKVKKSWYSEFQNKVVLNAAFDFSSPEFKGEFAKALMDFQKNNLEEP